MSEVDAGSLETTSRDAPDVEMGNEDDVEAEETLADNLENGGDDYEGAEGEEEAEVTSRLTFVDYLASPIVEIEVGSGSSARTLHAHQKLLEQSPFFADQIASFSADSTTRRIEFLDEEIETVGAFLQFLYTSEYFPRKAGDELEPVPGAAADGGEELLRHARVYTLAEKLGVQALKALAHSKVHRVDSSAKGEIAYARYVYGNTPKTDDAIRKPIASFWGQRSHVLRHEAEDEFRALCIEYPEFGFDVLSYVLDARERKRDHQEETAPKSGRKRARNQ